MNTLAKVEKFAVAVSVAIMRWWLLMLGTFYLCDYIGNEEFTDVVMVVAAIDIAYNEIKTCVFKCIDIVKSE